MDIRHDSKRLAATRRLRKYALALALAIAAATTAHSNTYVVRLECKGGSGQVWTLAEAPTLESARDYVDSVWDTRDSEFRRRCRPHDFELIIAGQR